MKRRIIFPLALLITFLSYGQSKKEWIPLFNGKDLKEWKASENPDTFSVVDGTIKASGPRAHLFYQGELQKHEFKNFEFRCQVKTMPGSNSGIYFHTEYQEEGWPNKGYEVQVNNTQEDWRRTGSLYGIIDTKETYVKDNDWYTESIMVKDKRIVVKINDIVIVDYTEPEDPVRGEGGKARILSQGTFALQGHDPGSTVFYKDIEVMILD